jgi:hypothetical protein
MLKRLKIEIKGTNLDGNYGAPHQYTVTYRITQTTSTNNLLKDYIFESPAALN